MLRKPWTRVKALLTATIIVSLLGLTGVLAAPAAVAAPTPPSSWFACNSLTACSTTDPVNIEYYEPGGHALEDLTTTLENAGWASTGCYNTYVELRINGYLTPPNIVLATDVGGVGGCGTGQRDHARLWASSDDTTVYVAASIEQPCIPSVHCVVSFDQGRDQLQSALTAHLSTLHLYPNITTISPYGAGTLSGVTYHPPVDVDSVYTVIDTPGGAQFYTDWQANQNVGPPVNNAHSVTGGQAQDFNTGTSYYSSGTGTHMIYGAIRGEYNSLGGSGGKLGMPTSDEQWAQPGGAATGGRENTFAAQNCGSGSAILWTSATGAHEMQGCIYNAYMTTYGGPAGATGFPVQDETPISGGYVSYMSGSACGSSHGSAIYWNGAAHVVRGCSYQDYLNAGGPAVLGFPTADEYTDSSGWHQYFQYGHIDNGTVTYNCSNYGGGYITGPNACTGFSTTSTWFSGGGVGLLGKEIWTYANGTTKDSVAHYHLTGMTNNEIYQLYAYIPNGHSDASQAHYSTCNVDQTGTYSCYDSYLNQNNYTNQWAYFQSTCTYGGTIDVNLSDDGGDVYPAEVGADAIKALPIGQYCS